MSFYEHYRTLADYDLEGFWSEVSDQRISRILQQDRLDRWDYLALLSPRAADHLEAMAQKAQRLTAQNFGRVMVLFTPMYVADHCTNACSYCGFSVHNRFPRSKLTLDQVEAEGRLLAATGLRHLLILTGESRRVAPVEYIRACATVLSRHFSSIGVEVYPLEEGEYRELVAAGVDSLTIYQEVYDEVLYDAVHVSGPKKNYRFRLDTPERGCRAGMRSVSVGALVGLGPWRREAFFTGVHAAYLQDAFPEVELSVSFPRLRPHRGEEPTGNPAGGPTSHLDNNRADDRAEDRELVQMMLALRLFLPRCGITISTREAPALRDNLVGLGVTRMSAGSCTAVGARLAGDRGDPQFEIQDDRSVAEIRAMLMRRGYKPVFKDWHPLPGMGLPTPTGRARTRA